MRESARIVSRRANAVRAERAACFRRTLKTIRLLCDRRDIARLADVVDAFLVERLAHAELGQAVANDDANAVADVRAQILAAQDAIEGALAALLEPHS